MVSGGCVISQKGSCLLGLLSLLRKPLFNHSSLLILVSLSFLFKRFISKEGGGGIVNGPDVIYNLVYYCCSLQASREAEHTWPQGRNFNNCFSKVGWIWNAVFHLLKRQKKLYFQYCWQAGLALTGKSDRCKYSIDVNLSSLLAQLQP